MMSQPPPSLPTLTAFLRSGQQQQQQQPQAVDRAPRGAVEKRRIDHGMPHQSLYTQDDSELTQRQKRRANMFVQYGDAELHGQPSYDLRQHPQQSYPSPTVTPYGSQPRLPPPTLPPPLADQHRRLPQQAPFREYSTNYRGPNPAPDARRVNAVKTEPPLPTTTQEPVQRERKSRYLSDSDRRSIITRIDHGEKQVALAKEYQVSRAAICNLYKNRKEVLTRAEREPKPKQVKRTAKTAGEEQFSPRESATEEKDTSDPQLGDEEAMSDEHSSTESIDTDPATGAGSRSPSAARTRRASAPAAPAGRVYDASSSSYPIRRFVSMLRNSGLPHATLRHATKRLLSCLMEEAIVCLPQREITTLTCTGEFCASIQPIDDAHVHAISMEVQGTVMLQTLLEIFPATPTTLVTTTRIKDPADEKWSVSCQRFPQIHATASVLLLATACETGTREAAVVEYLVTVGHVEPTNIYLVTVTSSQPGIARVHKPFPGVTVISAAIHDGVDNHGHGIGDLMDRFWHPDVTPR